MQKRSAHLKVLHYYGPVVRRTCFLFGCMEMETETWISGQMELNTL